MKKVLLFIRTNLILILFIIWGIYESIVHTDILRFSLALGGTLTLLYLLFMKVRKNWVTK